MLINVYQKVSRYMCCRLGKFHILLPLERPEFICVYCNWHLTVCIADMHGGFCCASFDFRGGEEAGILVILWLAQLNNM